MWKEKREQILITCVIGVLLLVVAVCCRPVFYLNDDVTMRSILSGSYTGVPDGHAVYMKYPLTGALSILYRIIGGIPWLELFFSCCFLWALWEILSVVKWKAIGLLVSFLFFLPFYLYMHYTVIAAVLAGTAVFLACAEEKRAKSILFWLVAWMVRSQVAYLSLPFLGVALLAGLLQCTEGGVKAYLKKSAGVLAAGVGSLLICVGLHTINYAGEEWQAYLRYNDGRTTLYDYTNFLSTDHYAKHYEQYGMTAEEFAVLNSYNTMLDGSIDEVRMEEVAIAVSAGMTEEKDETAWLKECVKKYYYYIRYPDNIYVVLWLAAVVCSTGVLLFLRQWRSLLLLGCLEGGRSLIWVFLIWKDRFPERVEVTLYILELFLLVGMIRPFLATAVERLNGYIQGMAEEKGTFKKPLMYTIRIGVMVVFCTGLAFLGCQIKADWERAGLQKSVQEEWTILKEYCGNSRETLYLADVFSIVEYSDLLFEQDPENIMMAGGWMSASPLAAERFAAYGATDGAQALFKNENVVFLAEKDRDVSWLEAYLQNRFGACELQSGQEILCGPDKILVEYRVFAE